jgi:cytochrome c biogenesis protein CcdA
MEKRKWGAVGFLVVIVAFLILVYTGFFHFRLPALNTYHGWLPALVGLSAILDSLNPCAFSVLFLTVAFLFSLGRSRRKIVEAGLAFIFGIFATYVLIGLGILHVLNIFNIPNFMSKVGATAIIIFGAIGLINEFFPSFPIKLKIPQVGYKRIATLVEKATIPATLLLGFVVGLFEFPCTGGPYLFVLGLLHDQSNILRGFAYLIFYNIMFVLPLLIALVIAVNRQVLETMDKIRRAETKQARIWVAVIMILLGVLIFVIQ